MNVEVISGLINLGSAGAVIGVVMIFLNYTTKRDAEWKSYIRELRNDDQAVQKKMDDSYVERNTALVTALNMLTLQIKNMQEFDSAHHEAMTRALSEMRRARRRATDTGADSR